MPDHHERQQLDELAVAIEAESSAWRAVKDRLPGTPEFDQALWARWLAAVERCRALRAGRNARAGATGAPPDGTE